MSKQHACEVEAVRRPLKQRGLITNAAVLEETKRLRARSPEAK